MLRETWVSLSVPGPCTHRAFVQEVARLASPPIFIESLSDHLNAGTLRGISCFDSMGNVLNHIAMNYLNVYWWVSEKGLNMAVESPQAPLSSFDALAGRLTTARWKNGLSQSALIEIAKEIDAHGFKLHDELQPAYWKLIAEHNQKKSRDPITTFEQAILPRFSRGIRRRLYIARTKFEKTQSSR